MNVRTLLSALLLASLGLSLAPAPAQAADTLWGYSASTGATYVKGLGDTITSSYTAQSFVSGGPTGATSSNSTAGAEISGITRIGAAETRTTATKGASSTTVTSWARTAGVNLLGGLITADAVETTVSTVGNADGTSSFAGNTKLLGIHVAGVNLPVNIPKNYAVTIPGVANVTLNAVVNSRTPEVVSTMGWAITVVLLKPYNGYPAGAMIVVNPANQYLVAQEPTAGVKLAGRAYGTRVHANVDNKIQVFSGPTALRGTPYGSSQGKTLTTTTANVNIPGLLTTGVVESTSTSSKDTLGNGQIRNTNQTAGLNLLNGLIKADVLKVSNTGRVTGATASDPRGTWSSDLSMTTVNLVVAGQQIPVNVGPNTTIDVAGLGKVTVNWQRKTPSQRVSRIDAVRITLDTARAGLPVGAVIEIGVAITQFSMPPTA